MISSLVGAGRRMGSLIASRALFAFWREDRLWVAPERGAVGAAVPRGRAEVIATSAERARMSFMLF